MLNYYQPFILPFLRLKSYVMPHGISRKFFLSFEDALWVLLKSKNIPAGSVVLLPDFYCMDVVDNIRAHGYRVAFYPLDAHFQISQTRLRRFVSKHRPKVIVIFHACGITSDITRSAQFVRRLCTKSIVIEDCVHRLVNPETLKVVHGNHFFLDSLRKVSPLRGSFLYGQRGSLEALSMNGNEIGYVMRSMLMYAKFRFMFVIGTILGSAALVRHAHEHELKLHDDLIGDSVDGYKGPLIVPRIHGHVDFNRVESIKSDQARFYIKGLKALLRKSAVFYPIRIPAGDFGLLHVFPLGIRRSASITDRISREFFWQHNIPIWIKFSDSPWSSRQSVLFLPLGFHVKYNELKRLFRLFGELDTRLS